jgi:hypothetical protein
MGPALHTIEMTMRCGSRHAVHRGKDVFRLGTHRNPRAARLNGVLDFAARVALLLALWLVVASAAQAATFVVDSTSDAGDVNIGNGVCRATGSICTLRAALQEASVAVGPTTINFNIAPSGAHTIVLGADLPAITSPVIINGTTQPGFVNAAPFAPVIELNGAATTVVLDLEPGSSGSTIRGLCINRSPGWAIFLFSTSNNVVAGNFLGTNLAGTSTTGLGNLVGVRVTGGATPADNNRVGGTAAADRNLISGNTVDGVQVDGGTGGAANTLIQGNYIGTDVNGTADLGNTNQGIAIFAATLGDMSTNTVIGGTAAGAGNLISGNNGRGIHAHDAGVTGTVIQGNKIGTNALGTAGIPNSQDGIRLYNSTSNNTIGGTAANAGNLIAFNGGDGVRLLADAGNGNSILGNAIYSNTLLGIDLNDDGVSANDALDADGGANTTLNFPVITSASESAGTVTANFRLDVAAGTYRIEFFKNPLGADPTGFGEGQTFGGTLNVTHPGGGSVAFSHTFAGSVGDRISATTTACTDGTCATLRSTSEFARTYFVTTAVTLMSFTAATRDGAVDLFWQTGSELSNLGFNLYRAPSADGPFERITAALIPGLGNSPEGARYSYRDAGLSNGTTYFYQLEDVETTGRTERHGPVFATPHVGDSADSGSGEASARITYGDPSATSFRILERSSRHLVVELRTGGFFATPLADGSVRVEIPSFQDVAGPGQPSVPVLRRWIEAMAGRKVQIIAVRPDDVQSFSLRPEAAPVRQLHVSADGTVDLVNRRAPRDASRLASFPDAFARVLTTAFQGDVKKAQLQIAPLRYDVGSGTLVLAKTVTVRISFDARKPDEVSWGGSRGRWTPPIRLRQGVLARLSVKDAGLYAVSFTDLFGRSRSSLPASWIGLSRQGRSVAFHLEPRTGWFGPGSTLYFTSDGAVLNPYGQEAVYELVSTRTAGRQMPLASAAPEGPQVGSYAQDSPFELNRLYQAALVDAPDIWLWDYIVSPATKAYPFTLSQPAGSGNARLTVDLQGGSDFDANPDHHVRVSVNGSPVAEASWDGKTAYSIEAEVASTLLQNGANLLEIQNVGDTGAAYSLVMLNRFSLRYPRATVADGGRLEGSFESSGVATVAGLSAAASLVDVTETTPRWLTGAIPTPQGLTFHVEAGRRYLAVARDARLRPRILAPATASLRSKENQADYLIITPREFLAAAEPLLEQRRAQGLSARAVAIEDVYAEFGYGETSPQGLKEFLAFAYHAWRRPSPRYVLLLGDASYDPKDYLKTGISDRIPGITVKTPFLWTISDPSYATVNGDDVLPDFAVGRLSAASLAEAQLLVDKLLAFERGGFSLAGPRVLVADNADIGGDFERDADEIAAGPLAGQAEKIYISQFGGGTRAAIFDALNRGASLMSYVGHGSTVIWASENVFNTMDLPNLAPQAQQPLLFTMDCLNGYFHMPGMSSLAEAFVKAEGRGAIAAFAPSGMSVDEPAHVYHKALLEEILSGRHRRLGDAILAAQARYTESGARPELLSIYHLLGDPALELR